LRRTRAPRFQAAHGGALLIALLAGGCAVAPASAPVAVAPGAAQQREVIAPPGAAATGAFSPAIRAGDFVFLSGQIGRGDGEDAIQTATRQALQSVRNVMDLAGLRTEELVKCTVFLIDMADFNAMNAVYVEWFGGVPRPARTTVAVAALPGGARVEGECMAYAPRR